LCEKFYTLSPGLMIGEQQPGPSGDASEFQTVETYAGRLRANPAQKEKGHSMLL
jgi:hypothetical protein